MKVVLWLLAELAFLGIGAFVGGWLYAYHTGSAYDMPWYSATARNREGVQFCALVGLLTGGTAGALVLSVLFRRPERAMTAEANATARHDPTIWPPPPNRPAA